MVTFVHENHNKFESCIVWVRLIKYSYCTNEVHDLEDKGKVVSSYIRIRDKKHIPFHKEFAKN